MNSAIILAGGFGTRLKEVVQDAPKPMAKIGDKPFLVILIRFLKKYGIKTIVLSVGYKKNSIISCFQDSFENCRLLYSIEEKPLKTGGAIKKALELVNDSNVFVLNGDSFFDVDLKAMYCFHKKKSADVTITLKNMKKFDRYGSVELKEDNRIVAFNEKKYVSQGYINGGIYILKKDILENEGDIFLFEDFLSKTSKKLYGYKSDGYFIDIGIPKDYFKAQRELKAWL